MYRVGMTERATAAVDALPPEALLGFAELRVALELAPWEGEPFRRDRPDKPIRTAAFNEYGLVIYLILEQQRRVEIIDVMWLA